MKLHSEGRLTCTPPDSSITSWGISKISETFSIMNFKRSVKGSMFSVNCVDPVTSREQIIFGAKTTAKLNASILLVASSATAASSFTNFFNRKRFKGGRRRKRICRVSSFCCCTNKTIEESGSANFPATYCDVM